MSNQNDLDDQLYILLASMKEYREAIADDNKRLEAFYSQVASGVLDKTPKNSDSAALKQKVLDIPADVVKQPNKANLSALDKRIRGITGAIAKNNLASRFQYGNESPLEMMKRIQSEITSHELADLWQNKLESMGIVF